MRRRTAAAAAAAVSLVFAVTGCGVPREDDPQLVRDRDVPFGLLETTTSTSTPTPTAPTATTPR